MKTLAEYIGLNLDMLAHLNIFGGPAWQVFDLLVELHTKAVQLGYDLSPVELLIDTRYMEEKEFTGYFLGAELPDAMRELYNLSPMSSFCYLEVSSEPTNYVAVAPKQLSVSDRNPFVSNAAKIVAASIKNLMDREVIALRNYILQSMRVLLVVNSRAFEKRDYLSDFSLDINHEGNNYFRIIGSFRVHGALDNDAVLDSASRLVTFFLHRKVDVIFNRDGDYIVVNFSEYVVNISV